MLGPLVWPDIQELIREKRWGVLRDALSGFDPSDVAEILIAVPDEDDVAIFRLLPRDFAGRIFAYLPSNHQQNLIRSLSNDQMRLVLAAMTPDDQARLLEELPAPVTRRLLDTLSPSELSAARDLLGYPAETAGRYMTPRYVALGPDMTAREALDYVRRTGRGQETLSILYIVDAAGRHLWLSVRQHATFYLKSSGLRPSHQFGAVRRNAHGRNRIDYLFQRRRHDSQGHFAPSILTRGFS